MTPELVSAFGNISKIIGIRPDKLTYNQFYLGLEMMGEDQRRELKERAIAARVGMADKRGWMQFMNLLDKGTVMERGRDNIERIISGGARSNFDEEEVEWLT